MENNICNFTILESPSRKYANTVNIVFFRAFPLYKNFSKYVDGLKSWKGYMEKYYPESQLQIFIDKTIANDKSIQTILNKLNARIYLFDCPEYKIDDTFHIGLFATMIRFYPMFDINNHPLKIAHIQELEPDSEGVHRFSDIEKISRMKFTHKLSFLHMSSDIFKKIKGFNYLFEDIIHYPWIIAGRFTVFEKFPFELFTNYLNDIKSGKKFINRYEYTQAQNIKKEHENYSFGVDEIFLNHILLPWMINNNKNIGIFINFTLAHPIYYLDNQIKNHKNSKDIFNIILQNKKSLNVSLKEFDNLFYQKNVTERAKQCAERFYEVIERFPNWLGLSQTQTILLLFKGYVSRSCIIILNNNHIVEIKDIT